MATELPASPATTLPATATKQSSVVTTKTATKPATSGAGSRPPRAPKPNARPPRTPTLWPPSTGYRLAANWPRQPASAGPTPTAGSATTPRPRRRTDMAHRFALIGIGWCGRFSCSATAHAHRPSACSVWGSA
ncbi:hypothetical protein NKG94_34360 [Micromonospora sp. M12]